MTAKELLKPRYKVIADYPDRAFEMNMPLLYNVVDCCFENSQASGVPIEPDKFPLIFKELDWWEERTPEELPKYVKTKTGTKRVAVLRSIPENETSRWCMYLAEEHIPYDPRGFVPATEAEFLAQEK